MLDVSPDITTVIFCFYVMMVGRQLSDVLQPPSNSGTALQPGACKNNGKGFICETTALKKCELQHSELNSCFSFDFN